MGGQKDECGSKTRRRDGASIQHVRSSGLQDLQDCRCRYEIIYSLPVKLVMKFVFPKRKSVFRVLNTCPNCISMEKAGV